MVRYVYDAWGNHEVKILDGTSEDKQATHIGNLNPFRYRGYYYDVETGLYFLKTRYYDPQICRFITIDDIQYLDPEHINGLNLYAYCGDNPVMYTDPTGQFVITALLIGLVVGTVVGAAIGGAVAYHVAQETGATGWELFGWTMLGIFGGGLLGGAIGAGIGAIAPAIGSFLGSSFALGSVLTASGELIAISVTGAQIAAAAGVAAGAGMMIMFAQWQPESWPGDDPTVSPGDGFEWRGKHPIGGDKGAWYNPSTADSLHPDLNHPTGIEPHWDWVNRLLDIVKRIFK